MAKVGAVLQPLSGLPGVDVLGAAVSSFTSSICSMLAATADKLTAFDVAARRAMPLRPLYAVSELERCFEAPFRFLLAAMSAFYADVVLPIMRTVGFVTVQTLA